VIDMLFTFTELAEEAAREADMRRDVYKRQRAGAGLTPSQKKRIAMMDAIAVHLQQHAVHDPPPAEQTDLLGGGQ
jgi:hypothetical protein